MSKLNYLISVSLNRKIKTKWFVITNIVIAVILIGLINIDSIITLFGGDFDDLTKVYVIDNTYETYDLFYENVKNAATTLYGDESSSYELIHYENSVEDAKKILENKEDKNSIIIVFDNSDNIISAKMISKEYMDIVDTSLLNTALNNTKVSLALTKSSIDIEELNKIYENIEIERIYLDENKNSADENTEMIMSTVFPIIILPFFMLTVFLIQMIGAEVNDEKTTRGMEIIISNVSLKTHFFSKVIAGNLFVFFQGALLFVFALIGVFVRNIVGPSSISNQISDIISDINISSIASSLVYIIPLTLLLMVLTFIAYSLLAGILASITTNTEDFQQLQTPIVFTLLIGYYLSVMAGLFKGALFIKILSFVPLISAILAPSLFVLGQIGIVEIIISILLVIIFIYLLIKYGLKVYKVGILNYSSKDLWKKMFKAIKDK